MVVSQNWSDAMSLATFAPISTEQSALRPWRSRSEMSTTPLSSKSMPLIADSTFAPGATDSLMVGMSGLRNWCGRQKQTIVAPLTASARSGTAFTFGVNLAPLRYLTFSLVSLIISVSGLPSIISSYTYSLTSLSKMSWRSAFWPRMRTSAEPKLPLPTIASFSLPAAPLNRREPGRARPLETRESIVQAVEVTGCGEEGAPQGGRGRGLGGGGALLEVEGRQAGQTFPFAGVCVVNGTERCAARVRERVLCSSRRGQRQRDYALARYIK
mmetsp:Transcript_24971/g.81549  ORF Transcript_24971/g.81549 Transcript_24971/m.81549 type:complete len:270 (-) Transcript_24971:33-842(-)